MSYAPAKCLRHATLSRSLRAPGDRVWGVNYFCPIFAFGNLRHEQVMTSMRLFVQEVMPAVR